MQIRHLPRHCCPVLDNGGSIRLASLEYYTMSMDETFELLTLCSEIFRHVAITCNGFLNPTQVLFSGYQIISCKYINRK